MRGVTTTGHDAVEADIFAYELSSDDSSNLAAADDAPSIAFPCASASMATVMKLQTRRRARDEMVMPNAAEMLWRRPPPPRAACAPPECHHDNTMLKCRQRWGHARRSLEARDATPKDRPNSASNDAQRSSSRAQRLYEISSRERRARKSTRSKMQGRTLGEAISRCSSRFDDIIIYFNRLYFPRDDDLSRYRAFSQAVVAGMISAPAQRQEMGAASRPGII